MFKYEICIVMFGWLRAQSHSTRRGKSAKYNDDDKEEAKKKRRRSSLLLLYLHCDDDDANDAVDCV